MLIFQGFAPPDYAVHIRHLRIRNFRGIGELDWTVWERIVCLIGPGDCRKTTILDAIEFALSPYWELPLCDTDFYNCNTEQPIEIEVTVGDVPKELLTEQTFGLYKRGFHSINGLLPDPDDESEEVITVRLEVDCDCVPEWTVTKPGALEPAKISQKDRFKLSMARLGSDADDHLSWKRGSGLYRADANTKISGAKAAATTQLRRHTFQHTTEIESEAPMRVRRPALQLGVHLQPLSVRVDIRALTLNSSALSLCEEKLPLRTRGLGSRRLAALAIEQVGQPDGSILLVDEFEHGLEPHRIRRAIQFFQKELSNGSEDRKAGRGQLIFTTHSPTPIITLPLHSLGFVRHRAGRVEVIQRADDSDEVLGRLRRQQSHILLAKKIIVCEGDTEEGMCRALDDYWASGHDSMPMASMGTWPLRGGGTNHAVSQTVALSKLGYEVLLFCDSDTLTDKDRAEVRDAGAELVAWEGSACTEQRVFLDAPANAVAGLLDLAQKLHNPGRIRQDLSTHSNLACDFTNASFCEWIQVVPEDEVRSKVGYTANKGKWFKGLEEGVAFGAAVVAFLPSVPSTNLANCLKRIEDWVYAE